LGISQVNDNCETLRGLRAASEGDTIGTLCVDIGNGHSHAALRKLACRRRSEPLCASRDYRYFVRRLGHAASLHASGPSNKNWLPHTKSKCRKLRRQIDKTSSRLR